MLGGVGGVQEKEGGIGSSETVAGGGVALWLRGGLCDAWRAGCGGLKLRASLCLNGKLFLRFWLSVCLPFPAPFSC